MVAINQPTRSKSNQLRSSKLQSASERSGNLEKRNHSSSHTFVVPQQATKFFVANDLLTFGKRVVNRRPLPSKRSVVQGLMRTNFVVVLQVRSDEVIEVLLAEDSEKVQALEFDRLYPSLDKSVLIGACGAVGFTRQPMSLNT